MSSLSDIKSVAFLMFAVCTCCLCSATYAGQLLAVVSTEDNGPLADAVVTVTGGNGVSHDREPSIEIVDQVNKQFKPYIKAIYVGSSVNFPNNDNIRHQVYSFSPAKRFVLPLYEGTPAKPIVFNKPGVVTLGCNIHDWMIGYIYVSETPWFAKTDAEGIAVITGLPAGQYHAKVWHPRMKNSETEILREFELMSDEDATLDWSLELKPDIRPRRAPIRGGGGYR